MERKRHKWVFAAWVLLVVAACLVLIVIVIKEPFSRWRGERWHASTSAQPTIALGVLVNGTPAVPDPEVYVLRGSTVTPTLAVDWGSGAEGSTELTLHGCVIPSGVPIEMPDLGVYHLAAEANTGRWARTGSIDLEVTRYQRLRASASVERFRADPFELVIRLRGEGFDLERADPATIHVSVFDGRNRPMDRFALAAGPDGSPDARFTGSEWVLRFTRPADAPALASAAAGYTVMGYATRGDERIEFIAKGALPGAGVP